MTTIRMDYNQSQPSSLHTPGTLNGEPVHLIPSSIVLPTNTLRISTGSLSEPLTYEIRAEGDAGKVAIKVVAANRDRKPHNVEREIRCLKRLNGHENIITMLNAYLFPLSGYDTYPSYLLFFPYYPYTLKTLLDATTFTPSSPSFTPLSLSLTYQVLSSLEHLHANQIAHRDVNPSNFVLSSLGTLKLIDFSVSISFDETDEQRGMEFDFGTTGYKPPELFFGDREYESRTLDLWSVGVTLCEFWLRFKEPSQREEDDEVDSQDEDDDYFEENLTAKFAEMMPERQNLFELSSSNSTEFASISQIFRLLGTPTLETWPEANRLKQFSYFKFKDYPMQSLNTRLEYLPEELHWLLKMLEGLIRISASERWSVNNCLATPGWKDVIKIGDERLARLIKEHL